MELAISIGPSTTGIAGVCAALSTFLSIVQVRNHLRLNPNSALRTHVNRILLMCPIYAWTSFFSTTIGQSVFFDTGRDCYEAFVIYSFFKFFSIVLGGTDAMLVILRSKSQQKHIFPFNVEWGVLQYVAVKPLMALFSLLLGAFGVFKAGDIAFDAGYFYVSFIVNCSQVWAIYCLIMMYLAFAEDLAPIRPIPKMLCIKALIFFTFWQSVLIALLVSIGWLKGSREDVARFEDLVICMEMVAFAIAHHYAFPPEDFSSEDLPAHITTPMLRSLLTAADVTDVIYDLRQGIGPSQSEKPLDQRDMTASTAAIFIANDPYRPANLVRTE